MAFDLGELERKTTSIVRDTQRLGEAFIENTMNDIDAIIGDVEACGQHLEAIRVRVSNRAVEYQTGIFRILVDTEILPATLIEEVWLQVASELAVEPNPQLFKLDNPEQAVWNGAQPSFTPIPPSYSFPDFRNAFFILHGMGYDGSNKQAFDSMYKPFEKSARMFNGDTSWKRFSDIYLVAYDTRLTDEARTIIRKGFASVLGQQVVGSAPNTIGAVLWRELERRANLTGEYLAVYLSSLSAPPHASGFVVAHSLGCFASAAALKSYALRSTNARRVISQWLCMAAALPANALTNSGIFEESLNAVTSLAPPFGTFVLFSWFDLVLGAAYTPLVNETLAMGQTGALIPVQPLANSNVSRLVGETHAISDGYLDKVGPVIRAIYGTTLASGSNLTVESR